MAQAITSMDSTDEPPDSGRETTAHADDRGRVAARRRGGFTPNLELREVRKGTKPGSRYVRLAPRREQPFRRVDEGAYLATEVATRPRTTFERWWRAIKRVVVGAPLATSQLVEERLSKLKGLAIFASDNLSSAAYATEEMLLILVVAGTAAFAWSIPIALAITGLVAIVVVSYSQVIRGYPNGGGAYIVAKENLGVLPGLVAGASLIADYILLVAVSIAAGVAAITSAIPELHDYRVPISMGFVVLLTLGNLRGIRESATIFAVPTYLFVISFGLMLAVGLVRLALGHDLQAPPPPRPVEVGTAAVTPFLILRAFSSGSAALTGIEAVSNGVPAFKPPEPRNAIVVLVWMGAILSAFFLGTTFLAHELDVAPSETKTVIAQIADTVFQGGPFFFIVQLTTMFILVLAANTSFAGLPALASVMARDRFLPRQFTFRGDRLAFSYGIVLVGGASTLLLIVFQAETHALIPLYAVGVFIGFTLAQVGLVAHWRREPATASTRASLVINAAGAAVTGVVTVIVAATKFASGAWITLAGIALTVFILTRIAHHYERVAEQLRITEPPALPRRPAPASLRTPPDPMRARAVIVPVDELNKASLRALEYACSISDNVSAVHVTDEREEGERLRERWEELAPNVPIVVIESPYRSLIAPMLAYVDAIDRIDPEAYITVVLPEFLPAHAWEGLLHNQSAIGLKKALRHRPNTIIIDVPYHLQP